MKVLEAKVIYESDNIEKYKKIISDIFYDFGVTGLKIEEPLLNKDPLNFYKDEKQFLLSENSVSAYFPLNIYSEKRKKVLEETFKEKFSEDEEIVYNLDFYEYDEEDYQNSWKKYLFVEKVSEKFVVKPTWREYEKQDNELVIELDPGRAFGTGSHPTTSLLLKLMEEQDFSNKSVIDIGTGSGILMIAGKILGAGEVYGTDIDEFSMEVAKENLILNNVSLNDVKLLKGNLLEVIEIKKFDIVVCNILADVLVKLLDEIKYILKENSIVLFSGIIEDKLNWIDKNKKLICKTFIEDEGMFYGLNDEIEKQLSKKEKAKIDDLEFSAPLTEDEFFNSLYIAYINFYIENEDDISCNFDLDCEPDYLFGHLANIELDEDNEILMGGVNG